MKKAIYNKAKRVRDFSFFRYFNPHKSPHTQINPITRAYDYFPKHDNRKGVLIWHSSRYGTYVRAKHGELSIKNPR